MKRIVAITVAKDYSDYLTACLPSVLEEFDESFVVVPPGSTDEQVARKLGAKTIAYEEWSKGEIKFNRAGAIRAAQEIIHAEESEHDAWIAIIDADIFVPKGTAEVLRGTALLKDSLIGIRRVDAHTQADLKAGRFTYYPHLFSGYFQMYHRKNVFYEELSRDASITDCLFRDKFNVWVTAEAQCLHLGQQYVNWSGRCSPNWFTT